MATLRTHDLTKSYGGRTVVRGVSLTVASGEIVGLLGPNGAGKTTTFYMAVGLTAPDSGRVTLDGADVTDDPMYVRARKGIGYLPQEPSIFRGLTVEQNVLTVHAERRAPESEAERIVDERSYGVFSRQLFLGDTLDSDKLTASYDAGVLTLSIPIAEKAKPRKVEIGTASGQAPKEINAA